MALVNSLPSSPVQVLSAILKTLHNSIHYSVNVNDSEYNSVI